MSNLKTEKGIGLILKNNDYSNKNHQQEEKNYEDKNLLCVADVILQALNEQTENWKWHCTSVKKRLLRTSAVRPHSDCCCHSGQLVWETQIHLGGLFDHVWAKKARTFSWEWRVCYMRWYAAYTWWFLFIGSKAIRMITQTLELTHKGFSPQLVGHKDDPSFQQQRGKNTHHLSYTQAVEQTFQVHMLQSGVHGPP